MGLGLHPKRTLYQLDSMAVWLSPGFGFGFGFASAFAIVCTVLVRGEEQWGQHIKGSQDTLCERGKGETRRGGGYFRAAAVRRARASL